MIGGRDILGGIAAAFGVARNDEGWEDAHDFSADRVFASFWAVALALPAQVLATEVQRQVALRNPQDLVAQTLVSIPHGVLLASQALTFLLVWAAELALLTSLAQRRGAGWKISPLILTFNWSKFLFMMVFAPLIAAALVTGLGFLAAMGEIAGYSLLLFLRFGIIRRTLDMSAGGAVGVLALLALTFIAVSAVVSTLLALFGFITVPDMMIDQ